MNTVLIRQQVSLIHASCRSCPFRLQSPDASLPPLYHATPQLDSFPRLYRGLDFAIAWQARRWHPAVSSSLSYGLVIHLLLLPTTRSLRSQFHSVTGWRAYARRGLSPL